MDKIYFNMDEATELLRLPKGSYSSLKSVVRKYKLPQVFIGKRMLFPIKRFLKRLEFIENKQLNGRKS